MKKKEGKKQKKKHRDNDEDKDEEEEINKGRGDQKPKDEAVDAEEGGASKGESMLKELESTAAGNVNGDGNLGRAKKGKKRRLRCDNNDGTDKHPDAEMTTKGGKRTMAMTTKPKQSFKRSDLDSKRPQSVGTSGQGRRLASQMQNG